MKALLSSDESTSRQIHEDWGTLLWLASSQVGNAQRLTLGRVTIKPGRCNPRHCHPGCEEVLYLLSGHLEHSVGDEAVVMAAGDVITIPPGVFHHARNLGADDADMIVAYPVGTRPFKLET